ncbi:MAG: RHS repeat-associated core domain-containing protein, partial [Chloroflexi bacterium]|nr:RHS repeat-associated core domain-containing protein [Chloroflexota bacterium]
MILNGQGAKLWEDRYKAFGDVYYTYRKDQGGRLIDLQTSYRYTGQRFDAGVGASAANGLDRGLYFYKSRYYDPTLGRFIQPDTIVPNPGDPQSLNRYAYVLNNPLRYTDRLCESSDNSCWSSPPSKSNNKPKRKVRRQQRPRSRYYYSKRYGWFDTHHIGAGHPQKILRDVEKAILSNGQSLVTVRGQFAYSHSYEAVYQVSAQATMDDLDNIAVAILIDWSHGFEKMELIGGGGLTFFGTYESIEDMPSNYLGMAMEVKGISFEEAMTILEAQPTEKSPPRYIKNPDIHPLIKNPNGFGFVYVSWPEELW